MGIETKKMNNPKMIIYIWFDNCIVENISMSYYGSKTNHQFNKPDLYLLEKDDYS